MQDAHLLESAALHRGGEQNFQEAVNDVEVARTAFTEAELKRAPGQPRLHLNYACLKRGREGDRTPMPMAYGAHPARSLLSLSFASAVVCHCMFAGESAPPQASGVL